MGGLQKQFSDGIPGFRNPQVNPHHLDLGCAVGAATVLHIAQQAADEVFGQRCSLLFYKNKPLQFNPITLISAAPLVPRRCSTSHSRRQMRSLARGGTATSAGKRRYCRQLTILRHVCIGSSAQCEQGRSAKLVRMRAGLLQCFARWGMRAALHLAPCDQLPLAAPYVACVMAARDAQSRSGFQGASGLTGSSAASAHPKHS